MFRAIASRYLPSRDHAIHSSWLVLASLCLGWLAPAATLAQTVNNGGTLTPVVASYGAMAVDSSGNIYFPGIKVLEAVLSGDSYTLSTIVPLLYLPMGPTDGAADAIAVDGSGNIYVTADGHGIFKITPTSSGYSASNVLDIQSVQSIAVDSSGNLYVATMDGALTKATLSSSGYSQTMIDSGFNQAYGLAVDSSDNVYVGDVGTGKVYKETLSGGSYTRSSIDTGLSRPYGVALDTSGNVYVSDAISGILYEGTPSGTTYTWSTLLAGLTNPIGVGLDGSGNIYINEGNEVLKLTQ